MGRLSALLPCSALCGCEVLACALYMVYNGHGWIQDLGSLVWTADTMGYIHGLVKLVIMKGFYPLRQQSGGFALQGSFWFKEYEARKLLYG